MPQDREKPWVIREVPEHTRRDVKAFAVQRGMSIADALALLVDLGLSVAKEDAAAQVLHLPARVFTKTASREEVEEAQRKLKDFIEGALGAGGTEE